MSDQEFEYDSDHDVSASHSKLIESVTQLDKGQRVKRPQRTEPTLEVSEFHLVKSGISDKDAVYVKDLAKSLGKTGHHTEIRKNIESTRKKAKLLPKPLEKPAADRIKRIIGFENTKSDLGKWNAIITQNRTAETLEFTSGKTFVNAESSKDYVKRFRLQSDLEKVLNALEPQKENVEQKPDEFQLTLKEILMKRREAARFRAQESYKQAKANRQKKIKSKKFHRIQRKEKAKLQLKDFEELQKTDPQAALEKLELLDKSRAQERMSLRHKSTGQWAKNKQIKAKYNKETRQELAEQLSISRELTQKIKKCSDSDDEDEDEDENTSRLLSASDRENPWVCNAKSESEIDQFIKGYRKYWDGQKKSSENTASGANNQANTKGPSEMNSVYAFDEVSDEHTPVESINDKASLVNSTARFRVVPNSNVKISKTQQIGGSNGFEAKCIPKAKIVTKKSKLRTGVHLVSTSTWNVEAVDIEDPPKLFNVKNSAESRTEMINDMFDSMEDTIKSHIESKLQYVKEKLDLTTRKPKTENKNRGKSDVDEFDGLAIKNVRERPALDEPLDETPNINNTLSSSNVAKSSNIKSDITIGAAKSRNSAAEIDPNEYINVKPKHLNTQVPDIVTGGDDALDDNDSDGDNHNIISEAFADDDVVDEFRKEKEEEVSKSKPKDIDLTLPGWGSWGGKNIRISKRKKKRFILKFPKDAPRKDENKGNVIIIEENNPKIREHQVNELPYPFTSVKDYEASIRMPIGRNFVPENSHMRLIEPAVKTSMGKIIEPMNTDVLVKIPEKKRPKPSFQKKGANMTKMRKIK